MNTYQLHGWLIILYTNLCTCAFQVTAGGQDEQETLDFPGKYDRLNTVICELPGATANNPQVYCAVCYSVNRYELHTHWFCAYLLKDYRIDWSVIPA